MGGRGSGSGLWTKLERQAGPQGGAACYASVASALRRVRELDAFLPGKEVSLPRPVSLHARHDFHLNAHACVHVPCSPPMSPCVPHPLTAPLGAMQQAAQPAILPCPAPCKRAPPLPAPRPPDAPLRGQHPGRAQRRAPQQHRHGGARRCAHGAARGGGRCRLAAAGRVPCGHQGHAPAQTRRDDHARPGPGAVLIIRR